MKNFIKVILTITIIFLFLNGCQNYNEQKLLNVKDENIKITFQKRSFEGRYTGKVNEDGKADGEGIFKADKDDNGFYLSYDGEFKAGELFGYGNLKTNYFTITFHNPEGDIERIGSYDGEINDGIADGKGVYTATNENGYTYCYTGSFSDNTFNGEGVRESIEIPDGGTPFREEGNFLDGEFTPTETQLFSYIGQFEPEFTVSEKEKEAIEDVEEIFESLDDDAYWEKLSEISDAKLTYQEYMKQADYYDGKIVHWEDLEVIQIRVDENFVANWGIIEIVASTSNGEIVYGYMIRDENDLLQEAASYINVGTYIEIYGVPLGASSYTNIMSGTTLCPVVFFHGVEIY